MTQPSKPATGTVYYDPAVDKLRAYDGIKWIYIDEMAPLTYCAICKVEFFEHAATIDHPFFKNNLEYLEWCCDNRK